jgi:hypothetical protein
VEEGGAGRWARRAHGGGVEVVVEESDAGCPGEASSGGGNSPSGEWISFPSLTEWTQKART